MNALQLLQRAVAIRNVAAERFPEWRDILLGTRIEVSQRMKRSGGTAQGLLKLVTLSGPLLQKPENEGEILNTVLHELAHVVARNIHGFNIKSHGPEWCAIAVALGCNGRRCHQMKTEPRKVAMLVCDRCAAQVPAGPRQAQRIRSGAAVYRHRKCGGKVVAR